MFIEFEKINKARPQEVPISEYLNRIGKKEEDTTYLWIYGICSIFLITTVICLI